MVTNSHQQNVPDLRLDRVIDDDIDDPGEDETGTTLGPDETPDAADPKSVNRARRKRELVDKNRESYLRRMLSDEFGRRFLWDMLTDLGAFQVRFGQTPAGTENERETWMNQGQAYFGQRLYRTLLKADHLAVHQMHLDHDDAFKKPAKPKMRTQQ